MMSFEFEGYTFGNAKELEAAKRDREKIDQLERHGRSTAEVARNYKIQIKEKGIRFETSLGMDFLDLLDRQTFTVREAAIDQVQTENRKSHGGHKAHDAKETVMRKRVRAYLFLPLYVILAFLACILAIWVYREDRGKKSLDEIRQIARNQEETAISEGEALSQKGESFHNGGSSPWEASSNEETFSKGDSLEYAGGESEVFRETMDSVSEELKGQGNQDQGNAEKTERTMLPRMEELSERNPDFVGWLQVPGTVIDYPVMYLEDDNDFYLSHDFEKKKDANGLLVLDKRCDADGNGINNLIHGHHMKSGAMFGGLTLYASEVYYREHSVILFSTLYEERIYEILAVFKSSVYDEETEDFRYFDYIQIHDEREFDAYVAGAKENSLYETGVEASWGDHLITLSTCEYSKENGRFVIVGREKH